MPSMAATGPDFCRVSTPTLTFSNAVNAGNSRMFWKVRATPRWLTLCVGMPSTLTGGSPTRPDSMIEPSCGVYTPVSELNSDVLPAPFGPMTARISPPVHLKRDCVQTRDSAKPQRHVVDVEDDIVGRCGARSGRRLDCGHVTAPQTLVRRGSRRSTRRRDRATRPPDALPG